MYPALRSNFGGSCAISWIFIWSFQLLLRSCTKCFRTGPITPLFHILYFKNIILCLRTVLQSFISISGIGKTCTTMLSKVQTVALTRSFPSTMFHLNREKIMLKASYVLSIPRPVRNGQIQLLWPKCKNYTN